MFGSGGGHGGAGAGGGMEGCNGVAHNVIGGGCGAGGADEVLWWPEEDCWVCCCGGETEIALLVDTLPGLLKDDVDDTADTVEAVANQ